MRTTALALTLLLLPACSDKANPGGADSGGTDSADGTDGTDGTGGTGDAGTPIADMPNGTFYVNFSLAPVGGLLVPFQAEVQSLEDASGARTFSMQFRATDVAGDTLSDVVLEATTTLEEDGSWTIPETPFVLPGAFAPTGSDVEVSAAFEGTSQGADFFCGSLTGQITTFSMDLAGSSFGGVPWDARGDGQQASCEIGGGGFDPIETCPTLAAGRNEGFPSADEARKFDLVLPSEYGTDRNWPLVFAYHGLGQNIDQILDSGLREMADSFGVILAVPEGLDFGGSPGWDAVNTEAINKDLQLFDDMLTCVTAQYDIDRDRVFVTGMSNGGLMAGALMARRSPDIAAAAPISGGVITEWPADAVAVPTLITWGGVDDEAYEQDFHQLSLDLIAESEARGHFHVKCDHGLGHELLAEFWPWNMEFLLAHPKGVFESPFAGGLPDRFPAYCGLPD